MRQLLLLLWTVPLSALPLNNPMQSVLICESSFCKQPCGYALYGMLNGRVGFYGDYMFDTAMKVRRGGRDDQIRQFSVMTNALEVDITLCGFDLTWTVGSTKLRMATPSSTFQTNTPGSNTELYVESSSTVSGGLGGRFALWQRGPLGVGVEGQYLTTNPHINMVLDVSTGAVNRPGSGMNVRYRAGQVGAGVNYEFAYDEELSFDPYMGLFWTYSTVAFGDYALSGLGQSANENIRLYDLKKVRQYGWALGLTAVQCSLATITIEGRFGGEKAAFVFGQIQY